MATTLVAVTGGVASGKSEATRAFEALGVSVVDADVAAREVVAPGQPALQDIVARFGAVLRAVNPALDAGRPLLKPVTMSLFGMLNWVYMWFRPDGGLTREEYADLATTLILEGVRAVR